MLVTMVLNKGPIITKLKLVQWIIIGSNVELANIAKYLKNIKDRDAFFKGV